MERNCAAGSVQSNDFENIEPANDPHPAPSPLQGEGGMCRELLSSPERGRIKVGIISLVCRLF